MQPPQKPRYTFLRRINKMNWDLLNSVDVSTIARTGDTASVEYLMQSIAFANITQEDIDQFGSRSALHAFLILQMGVEILLGKLNSSCSPIQNPPPTQQPTQIPPQLIAQYEARINLLNKDIQARDMIISNLTEKLKYTEQAKEDAYHQMQSKSRKHLISNSNHSDSIVEVHPRNEKVNIPPNSHIEETGNTLHLETEYFDYLKQRPDLPNQRKSHHSSKNRDVKSTKSKKSEIGPRKTAGKSSWETSSES